MRRDGIAFWLKTIDCVLFHHSDSLPRRLFKLRANIWYVVDVVFHVEAGTYDLRILSPQVGGTHLMPTELWSNSCHPKRP
jgi:hypothetical protein